MLLFRSNLMCIALSFPDDAVGLEKKLHTILNDKRVNKVNMRKEFFYTTIDELEQLVTDIEPTAEFQQNYVGRRIQTVSIIR